MGFSVTIASTIILMGLIFFAGAGVATMIYTMNNLTDQLVERYKTLNQKMNVKIDLEITSISSRTVKFLVKNVGSKTIFLRASSFRWNSVIIAYKSANIWYSYLVDDYTVNYIQITGSTVTFPFSNHKYINPGEEAAVTANLPADAPNIPQNAPVIIVFISHYGVSAMKEGANS